MLTLLNPQLLLCTSAGYCWGFFPVTNYLIARLYYCQVWNMGYRRPRKVGSLILCCWFINFCSNAIQCRLGFHVESLLAAHFFMWIDPNRYSSLAPLYYRGASAAVVVYDITNPETFQKAQFWVKVRNFTQMPILTYSHGGSHSHGDLHCWRVSSLAVEDAKSFAEEKH